MGRQVCFFLTPKDLSGLINALYARGVKVVDDYGNNINLESLTQFIENDFNGKSFTDSFCYMYEDGFKLAYFDGSKTINQIESEVIQFRACRQQSKKIMDTSSVEKNFEKGGFIVIDNTEEYQRQMDECRKNPVYIDNPLYVPNGFEHGRFWCSTDYYNEYGEKVNKCKELKSLFSFCKRYITKNARLSKTKFAYIGEDAYQKYLEGTFIPCSGRSKIEI